MILALIFDNHEGGETSRETTKKTWRRDAESLELSGDRIDSLCLVGVGGQSVILTGDQVRAAIYGGAA